MRRVNGTTIVTSCALFSLFFYSSVFAFSSQEDPLFFRQWQFQDNRIATDVVGYDLGFETVDQMLGPGEKTVILFVGYGAKLDHEDLQNSFWINPNEIPNDNIDNDNNGYIDDVHGINIKLNNGSVYDRDGFGTQFAGIVNATIANGKGIRGMSPRTKIALCNLDYELPSGAVLEQIAEVHKCLDYAIYLKEQNVNLAAVVYSYAVREPVPATREFGVTLSGIKSLIAKIEENDILWVNGMFGEPLFSNGNILLDVNSYYPHSMLSPNHVFTSHFDRGLGSFSNISRFTNATLIADDILTTTLEDDFVLAVPPIYTADPTTEEVLYSDEFQITEHPIQTDKLVWSHDYLGDVYPQLEFTFPNIDISQTTQSKYLIDLEIETLNRINSIRDSGTPRYSRYNGNIRFQYREQGKQEWETFWFQELSDRGILDIVAVELDMLNFYSSVDNLPKAIDIRIELQVPYVKVAGLTVWTEDQGILVDGYDYASPLIANLAQLAVVASTIKSYQPEWPAWKIANAISAGNVMHDYFDPSIYPYNISGFSLYSLFHPQQGSLNCVNKSLQRRIFPSSNSAFFHVVGEDFIVKTKSIDCERPGDVFTYIDPLTGQQYDAVDNGEGYDAIDGDGSAVLAFNTTTAGERALQTQRDHDLNIMVFNRFAPIKSVPYEWINVGNSANTEAYFSWFSDTINFPFGGIESAFNERIVFTNNRFGFTTYYDTSDIYGPEPIRGFDSVEATKSGQTDNDYQYFFELSNLTSNNAVRIDDRLQTIRVYAAPKIPFTYESAQSSRFIENGSQTVVTTYEDIIQFVFKENESQIVINYGKLPDYLEGLEYAVGIEIGPFYTQRKLITLRSNTSYEIDVSVDTDGDGIDDSDDPDIDNDGVVNEEDAFPFDNTESADYDLDGIGDNADADDDNDGIEDGNDALPYDTDNDGITNLEDDDDDADGVNDADDRFPLDPSEQLDFDRDGVGNNADNDDDNDGRLDDIDDFPFDASEQIDTDEDGIGNNADNDDDGDGVNDPLDAFPLDSSEVADYDFDGIGDNADNDDDNDGVEDSVDAFPTDAQETIDTDGDGIGNNADSDDDGDGVIDANDPFPLDASRSGNAPVTQITPSANNGSSGGGSINFTLLMMLCYLLFLRRADR